MFKKLALLFCIFANFLQWHKTFRYSMILGKIIIIRLQPWEMFKTGQMGEFVLFCCRFFTMIWVRISIHLERTWKLPDLLASGKAPITAHIEYNGGLGSYPFNGNQYAFPINNAWLLGADYNMHNADFTKNIDFAGHVQTHCWQAGICTADCSLGASFFEPKSEFYRVCRFFGWKIMPQKRQVQYS